MAGLDFLGILLIIINVNAQQADFNCNQRPPFIPDVKNCCKRPTINLDKYKILCSNVTTAARFGMKTDDRQAFMNPCSVDCMYTQAGALNNTRFNLSNLKSFLTEVMPVDPDLVKVFYAGFQKCSPEVQQKMQEIDANRPVNAQGQPIPYPGPQCSPYAILTTACAIRYVFVNCPTNDWTSNDVCNSAQTYVKNCDPMNVG